jgi:YrbI family 3-deoxy-D-manno-octulosonate 8-phosphate phosphatase
MSILAVIPARGGSKGILRKNIKPLCGKPLVAWTIEAAHVAQSVNRVVVSTDDVEIAEVARRSGAEVVMRPRELSGDLSTSESALLHVLSVLRERENYQPEGLAFLQCTAPLTLPEDIDGTMNLVLEGGYDSAVTMIPFHYFVWREGTGGQMEGVNHLATRRLMRQEREPQFLEIGAVYAMRAQGLADHQFRFFGRVGRYLLPASRAVEIDDAEDWLLVEKLMHSTGRVRLAAARSQPWAQVQAVVTDFDGVMTDNRVVVGQDGKESVVCNRGDGWGISLLKQTGLLVACISTEENPVVRARCEKLEIPYWQGQRDKLSTLKALLERHGIQPEHCLYVGNDTNDASCLEYAAVAVVPRDAVPEVLHLADWQTEASGGEGVLREIASRLLDERKQSHD